MIHIGLSCMLEENAQPVELEQNVWNRSSIGWGFPSTDWRQVDCKIMDAQLVETKSLNWLNIAGKPKNRRSRAFKTQNLTFILTSKPKSSVSLSLSLYPKTSRPYTHFKSTKNHTILPIFALTSLIQIPNLFPKTNVALLVLVILIGKIKMTPQRLKGWKSVEGSSWGRSVRKRKRGPTREEETKSKEYK